MPILSILTFFAIFIFIVLIGLYVFLIFYNKRARTATEKFIRQARELRPTIFQNIRLRYWTTSGLRTRISSNSYCDLYLFDNSLAIARRQNFIFKVFFAPILLTSDITITRRMFTYLDTYKPARITFKQIVKGEIDIKIVDPVYKHYIIDPTLKGLSTEQINQLEKLRPGASNQNSITLETSALIDSFAL